MNKSFKSLSLAIQIFHEICIRGAQWIPVNVEKKIAHSTKGLIQKKIY